MVVGYRERGSPETGKETFGISACLWRNEQLFMILYNGCQADDEKTGKYRSLGF
jgi:hypothetical protein